MSKEIKNIQKTEKIFEKLQEKLENLNEDTNLNELEEDFKEFKNILDD